MKRSLLLTAAFLMMPLTGAFAATNVPTGQQNQTIEAQISASSLQVAQQSAQNSIDSKNAVVQLATVQTAYNPTPTPGVTYKPSAVSYPPIDIAQPLPGGKYVIEKVKWGEKTPLITGGYYKTYHVKSYNKDGILEREDWYSVDTMYDYTTRKMQDFVQEHYIKWYDGSNGMFWDAWREKFDCYGRLTQRDTFDMHMNMNNCYLFDVKTGAETDHMWFDYSLYKNRWVVTTRAKVNKKGDATWIEHYTPGAFWSGNGGLFGGWYDKKEYLYYDSNGKLIRKDFFRQWGSKIYRRETWDPVTGGITNVQLF